MATAVVFGNDKTQRMMTFGPDERAAQPADVRQRSGDARPRRAPPVRRRSGRPHRHQLRVSGGEGHPQGRRRGGGGQARSAAGDRARPPSGQPARTACPSRPSSAWGCGTTCRTTSRTGEICAEAGVTWIALHARSVEQHYAGEAHWEAIGELKRAVPDRPGARQRRHLAGIGRGRDDAGDRMRRRGGRPWVPRPTVAVR